MVDPGNGAFPVRHMNVMIPTDHMSAFVVSEQRGRNFSGAIYCGDPQISPSGRGTAWGPKWLNPKSISFRVDLKIDPLARGE
jgi:hypothetical protein